MQYAYLSKGYKWRYSKGQLLPSMDSSNVPNSQIMERALVSMER